MHLVSKGFNSPHLYQKRFTADFLTKELRVNNGEVPQYYVEGSHEAIIAPEEFESVQEEMSRRKELGRAYSDKAFHSKIICGDWKIYLIRLNETRCSQEISCNTLNCYYNFTRTTSTFKEIFKCFHA
jgi:hypothetical protein